MAHTAHKTEAECKEHFDNDETLLKKVKTVAQWVRESEHFIVFTGAGVSTACGIPDFRSGLKTVLPTGPGGWTLKAAKKERTSAQKNRRVDTLNAIPSDTHMSLVKLNEDGILKYLVSQNCDGLHRRSGFPPSQMSELHGNTNLEFCTTCGTEYMRDFRCRTYRRQRGKPHTHLTGRKCTVSGCGGDLKDTLICFTEQLPKKPKRLGFQNAREADLCLVLGSSCTVTPASEIPEMCGRHSKKRLVICNLQSTPLDDMSDMRLNGKCEDVMKLLMKELNIEIPEFRLRRFLKVEIVGQDPVRLKIRGVDSNGVWMSLVPRLIWHHDENCWQKFSGEPYTLKLYKDNPSDVCVELFFEKHYAEPSLRLKIAAKDLNNVLEEKEENPVMFYALEYDPIRKRWAEPRLLQKDEMSEIQRGERSLSGTVKRKRINYAKGELRRSKRKKTDVVHFKFE